MKKIIFSFLLVIIALFGVFSSVEAADDLYCYCSYTAKVEYTPVCLEDTKIMKVGEFSELGGVFITPTSLNCENLLNDSSLNGVICKDAENKETNKCELVSYVPGASTYSKIMKPEWNSSFGVSKEDPVVIKSGDVSELEIVASLKGFDEPPLKISCLNCVSAELTDLGGGKAKIIWNTAGNYDFSKIGGDKIIQVRVTRIDYPGIFIDGEIYYKIIEGVAKKSDFEEKDSAILSSVTGIDNLNKLGNRTIQQIVGQAIKVVMGIVGSIALVMFTYAGVLWMIGSTEANMTKAKSILVWSSLGIIIIFASYAIIDFVFEVFR